jgi:ornithine cyclodeaminase
MAVTILTEAELRECVSVGPDAIEAVEACFTWLAEGRVTMPPIMHIDVSEHGGEMDIKSAYVRGIDSFAVKIGSGFFGNPKLGLPSSSAMMVVVSAHTGFVEAVLLDNGYLTDVRTGAAGAVAAKYLAPRAVDTVGVIGAGAQARYQILALKQVRDFDRLLVHSRHGERLERYVVDMARTLETKVEQVDDPAELVRRSEIVVTTTPATAPVIEADWLHPGLHITAMGSDSGGKQELEAAVVGRADLVVCDSRAQCLQFGELREAVAMGAVSEAADIIELGELTSGRREGRSDDGQISVCDLTGTGVQDTAIALLACERAHTKGLGTRVEL